MLFSPLFIATVQGSETHARRLLALGHPVDRCEPANGATVLHAAAELGHSDLTKLFVRAQADVNLQEPNDCTPLYIAALNGRLGVARTLIQAQANVDLGSGGTAPISIAAENGHFEVVAALIAAKADVNAQRITGSTSLFLAAQNGHSQVVTELIAAGASVDLQQNKGYSPLHIACQAGHLKVAELLVEGQADVNLQNLSGCTALYIASQQGHYRIVETLIRASADVNLQRCTGESALYIAAQNGHDLVAKALARSQADINLCTESGESPLYTAARYGHYKVALVLIQAGANVNQAQSQGCSPLLIASEFCHHRTVSALIGAGADLNLGTNTGGATPLFMAAQNGSCQVAAALIKAGADVNSRRIDGTTATYVAAQNGHLRIVEVLLRARADPDVQDTKGRTPMFMAAQNGHSAIVATLLRAQANPELAKSTGETPLFVASEEGHEGVVGALIGAQAGLDTTQRLGYSPLYIAAQNGHQRVVNQLAAAHTDVGHRLPDDGATPLYIAAQQGHYNVVMSLATTQEMDPDAQMVDGTTPLYAAAQDGHLRVVEILIEAAADVNLQRATGEAPLHSAAQNGHALIVQALLRAHADPDTQRWIGSTPLYMAARRGHLPVVEALLQAQASVNLLAFTGQSPLHAASESNCVDIVDRLLGASADLGARTVTGETAFDLAFRLGHRQVSERLLAQAGNESVVGMTNLRGELRRSCCLGNATLALQVMELCALEGSSVTAEVLSAFTPKCAAILLDCLQAVETRLLVSTEDWSQEQGGSPGQRDLDEFEVSEKLHRAFLQAGFSQCRASMQACLSDVLQDVARRRRQMEEIFVVGSYSEGWGNSLAQLNGRTAPDSDIDVTEFYPGLAFHIRGRCCCIEPDIARIVPYENGHVKWEGYSSSPARPKAGSELRPAIDIVPAFRCCCYPPGIHLPAAATREAVTGRSKLLLSELRQELAGSTAGGCHLVTAAPPGKEGRQLRVSTTFLERRFMRALDDLQGQLFLLLKFVIKRVLSPQVKGLKTYNGKTLLFRMVDATPAADWQPRNLVELTRRALLLLVDSLQSATAAPDECMRHYFMPDAILYLRKGSSKTEIVDAIRRTADRLPAILNDFKDTILRPLSEASAHFYFHPFLILPHPLYSAECTTQAQKEVVEYHQIYDLVKHLLVSLSDGHQCSLADLLDAVERLPDCAATARECLRAAALLKHENAHLAALAIEASRHRAVSRGVPCPVLTSKEFVWQHLLSTDSAWKFCYVFEHGRRPSFAYLPQIVQANFLVELPNYDTYYYLNFDALMMCLSLELAEENVPWSLSTSSWFEEVARSDSPDPQELLTTIRYCTDLSTMAALVLRHGAEKISGNALLEASLMQRELDWPELEETCILATLNRLKSKLELTTSCPDSLEN